MTKAERDWQRVEAEEVKRLRSEVADIKLVISEYMMRSEPAPEPPRKLNADAVNHPKHYTLGIEVIDAIEAWGLGFHLGNCIKYIARADHKASRIEDLKKARWYLDRAIARAEKP